MPLWRCKAFWRAYFWEDNPQPKDIYSTDTSEQEEAGREWLLIFCSIPGFAKGWTTTTDEGLSMLPRRRTLFWPVFLSSLTSDGLAQSENHRWSSNTATAKGWPTKTLGLSFPHLQNTHKKPCKGKHYLHIDQLRTQGPSHSQCSTLISHGGG